MNQSKISVLMSLFCPDECEVGSESPPCDCHISVRGERKREKGRKGKIRQFMLLYEEEMSVHGALVYSLLLIYGPFHQQFGVEFLLRSA